ncbi:MAG: hypothetical protein ACPGRD_05785 [Planktomarina sp.]
MFAMLRVLGVGFVVLSVIYICLVIYSRSARREKLARWWDESDKSMDKETYVQDGLKRYEGSLRRKLILGVYIVPAVLMVTVIYATNFQ